MDPHSAWFRQDLCRSARELVLRNRTRPGCRRAPDFLAAWQGFGRLVVDQRHGLHPRPTRGLRPLAATGQSRLVGVRRAAVFPARRASDAWRGCVPLDRRTTLRVRREGCASDCTEAFIKACNDAGYPRNDDFNGRDQEGAGYHQTTTRNGRRCSTAAVGYLHPVRSRGNLPG